jgi:glycogen(starch) synthase
MKILQYSPVYRPTVGGLEFVVRTLGQEFLKLGHESRILTNQDGSWHDDAELGVVRRPTPYSQLDAIRWADAVICHQDALRLVWPLALISGKPALMIMNMSPQKRRWPARVLMQRVVGKCRLYASSQHLAKEAQSHFVSPCGVLPNPYDPGCFFLPSVPAERPIDLVFVGRLAFVKGVDLFVESLAELARSGQRPTVKIIGDGEDRPKVERLIQAHGLAGQVELLGTLEGGEIADILRKTFCLVVPSRFEPFGIVALEGRACGCRIVATNAGGLPEASGNDALIVQHSSAEALTPALREVLRQREAAGGGMSFAQSKDILLQRHEPRNVAAAYLDILASAVR